jgi:hypothetical protein
MFKKKEGAICYSVLKRLGAEWLIFLLVLTVFMSDISLLMYMYLM